MFPNGSVDDNIILEDGDRLLFKGLLDGNIEATNCDRVIVTRGATIDDGNVIVEDCESSRAGSDVRIGIRKGVGTNPDNTTIMGNVEVMGSDLRLGKWAVVEGNVNVVDGVCSIHPDATVIGNLEGTCA